MTARSQSLPLDLRKDHKLAVIGYARCTQRGASLHNVQAC